PAYDMVSTIPYIPSDKLALQFVQTKDMKQCDIRLFEKLADKARLPKKLVVDTARETAETTREAWSKNKPHYALPSEMEKIIDTHMKGTML
ncbi:MAG: hypothetical protein KC643_29635, partial [Nitrospira sp.]|nr:hypothetical protein [Nitrospira sp.]